MQFLIAHPKWKKFPYSFLAQDALIGATSILLKNTDEFVLDNFALLGIPGNKTTEVSRVKVITRPQTVTINAAQFGHKGDTQVTMVPFDSIKLYRSTTGLTGTYTFLDKTTIAWEQDGTYYNDQNGQANYYYKFTYFNSVSSLESDLSDPFSGAGFVLYSKKTMVDRVLSLFGDPEGIQVDFDEVGIYLNEFYELSQVKLSIATKRFNIKTQLIQLKKDVDAYILNGDFLVEKSVKLSIDNGKTFPKEIPMRELDARGSRYGSYYDANYSYSQYSDGENPIIEVDPPALADTHIIRVRYTPTTVILDGQSDVLISPFTNKSAMFVKYALGMCHLKDKKYTEWQSLTNEAKGDLDDFIMYIKRLSNKHAQEVSHSNG